MSASRAELAKVWQEGFEAGEESVLSMGPDTNPYLAPVPVAMTREEMAAFANDWDAKVEAGRAKKAGL